MKNPACAHRLCELRARMTAAGVDLALLTDDDSVYYFSGYHGYLHMEFGRPTVLAVWRDGEAVIVTPAMELEMARRLCAVDDIRPWQDGVGGEWREPLDELLGSLGAGRLGVDATRMPPLVRQHLDRTAAGRAALDLDDIVADIRMVKSDEEIRVARHAGMVATAMMDAARAAIGEGVPEYEIAIATSSAGTRKAAELLAAHYDDELMSPSMHFLQIMASGRDTTMPHHRATNRRLARGEPVFLCFCGMTNFRRFKLGFDRMFWVGEVVEPRHREIYEVALASQRAALATVRAGVSAEQVHAAYAEVIQAAGYEFPFRCGRATGASFLERPQITLGDTTLLQPGMVLAVDGSVNVPGFFRAQVGDSLVVTETGYELLTDYPKRIEAMVVA